MTSKHGTVTNLTDPRALRAYAHPVRMQLMKLLRSRGQLTATGAAELLGESSGTCSFHLRQLAKYGLVEEAGGGTGREKPWRATTTSTMWSAVSDDPATAAAAGLLNGVLIEQYFEQATRWLERSPGEPAGWQRAASFGDKFLWVTAGELEDLYGRVQGLLDEFFERQVSPALRPEGARVVQFQTLAFPIDD